jgi:DNA-binding NarL/FixJ family response regulator
MTRLTRREIEVCAFLCKGWDNKEVGRKLRISHRTVEDHRYHILRKYHCRNVVELVLTVFDIPDQEDEQP